MIITICAAFILVKIKHLRIAPLFSTWTFYPILITQCFLILAQFCGTQFDPQAVDIFAGTIESIVIAKCS